MTSFNCTKCGLCCSTLTKEFMDAHHLPSNPSGRGCANYNKEEKLCTIYDTRHLVCRIEELYETKLKDIYTKEEWYRKNEEACKILQDKEKE